MKPNVGIIPEETKPYQSNNQMTIIIFVERPD
jgi:hypothetical protein